MYFIPDGRDGLFSLVLAPPRHVDDPIVLVENFAELVSDSNIATGYYEDLNE